MFTNSQSKFFPYSVQGLGKDRQISSQPDKFSLDYSLLLPRARHLLCPRLQLWLLSPHVWPMKRTLDHQKLVDVTQVTNLSTLAYPSVFIISNHFPPLRNFLILLVVQLCIFLLFSMFWFLMFYLILCQECFSRSNARIEVSTLLTFKNKWEFTVKPSLFDRQ